MRGCWDEGADAPIPLFQLPVVLLDEELEWDEYHLPIEERIPSTPGVIEVYQEHELRGACVIGVHHLYEVSCLLELSSYVSLQVVHSLLDERGCLCLPVIHPLLPCFYLLRPD